MLKLKSYIELTRPANGLIAAASILVGAVITGGLDPVWRIALACISGFCIAGGGNSINDYFDIEIDRINRPNRPLPSARLSRKGSLLFTLTLFVIGTGAGVLLGPYIGSIAFGSTLLLILYSAKLKGTVLAGNICVAFVASLAFVYGGAVYGRLVPTLIPAWFALLFHLIREIIKDMQDQEGDRQTGVRTLPVAHGLRAAQHSAAVFIVMLMAATPFPYILNLYTIIYLLIVLIGVDTVLLYVAYSLYRNPSPTNLGRLSFILKCDMIVGLAAIYFGR